MQGHEPKGIMVFCASSEDGPNFHIENSITWGAQSSDENGYRNSFHKRLEARGNKVDFVGNVTSGSMADDEHEGHRGYVIADITTDSNVGIYAVPNIALVHAGTNGINKDRDVGTAPSRLKALIKKILTHSPDVVVLDVDSAASIEQDENKLQALIAKGSIELPQCDSDSSLNDWAGQDPWDVWRCRMAQAIDEEPNGMMALALKQANADLKAGNFDTQEIGYFKPTNQIRAYHPRTSGMHAYKDVILAQMKEDGLF
ncbi:hypothetical protein F4803DRAFT_557872 [Xylaria telfairii]|nr:hypothetical protein F4803DRAFT_557872 [Xylaria telfairii]